MYFSLFLWRAPRSSLSPRRHGSVDALAPRYPPVREVCTPSSDSNQPAALEAQPTQDSAAIDSRGATGAVSHDPASDSTMIAGLAAAATHVPQRKEAHSTQFASRN